MTEKTSTTVTNRDLRQLVSSIEKFDRQACRLTCKALDIYDQAEEKGIDRDALRHVINARSLKAFCGERKPSNLASLYQQGLKKKAGSQDD